MKEIEVWKENENDIKAESILQNLGYTRPESKVIVYLISFKEGTSSKIERSMNIRQPEVSQATTSLHQKKFLKQRTIPSKGKDRPRIIYSLIKPAETLTNIERDTLQKIKTIHSQLKELKSLVSEVQ